ncbi:MAG TPA: IS4 family transposase [Chryseolinea sp.]|nr:IS4 family transposase [Chryseolinea sp.]
MHEANVKIIARLKRFVALTSSHRCILQKVSMSEHDFVRERKLPFSKLVLFIVKLSKKTLSIELEKFFEDIDASMSCSVSAFSQQRVKLKADFFKNWHNLLQKCFYLYYGSAIKRWKGYRVIAGDGSSICLVNNPALNGYFGGQSNQQTSFVQAKAFYHYDVLNEIILRAEIKPYRCGELTIAYKAMDEIQEDMLMIYDRNFSNYKAVALHAWQRKERKFIIRGNESKNMIKDFIKSKKISSIENMKPSPSAITGLRKSGFEITKDTLIPVRLVRVDLPHSVEVLITNLWEEEGHPTAEFKDLYFMRWGIETNISIQKNILQLESFSGLTVLSVLQDFYATVMMTNLHSILIKGAQQTAESTSTARKYPVKINRNKSFGKLKVSLVSLFIHQDPLQILMKLHDYFVKDILPVRRGRSFMRIRKNAQSKSKHKTFTNFKPAF